MTHDPFWRMESASTQLYSAGGYGQAGVPSPLGSIHLRISALSTGEDVLTDQVRNKDLVFMTETLRVSVDTGILPSITPRGNLKTAMIPVGPLHRHTRGTVGWLTGGRCMDMKDKVGPHILRRLAYGQSKHKHRQGNTNAEQDPLQILRCSHVCNDRIEHRRFHSFMEDRVCRRFTHG